MGLLEVNKPHTNGGHVFTISPLSFVIMVGPNSKRWASSPSSNTGDPSAPSHLPLSIHVGNLTNQVGCHVQIENINLKCIMQLRCAFIHISLIGIVDLLLSCFTCILKIYYFSYKISYVYNLYIYTNLDL